MKAVHLQTEYLTNPVGIDITSPRFYWNCESGTEHLHARQTAYRIVCMRCVGAKKAPQSENSMDEILWDSGKVASSSMSHIRYGGTPLRSRDIVRWSVVLWDEKDNPGEVSESIFEIGLLEKSDWKAQWISGNYKPKKNRRYPVDCFRKNFHIDREVAKARLYITACGLYEAYINGRRVGEFILAPGVTDYRKRIQYQTIDVTGLIRKENTLEILLADGWYRGSIGCFGQTNVYGRQTKLLCQLEICYADGKCDTICSDGSFAWSNDGPVRFADLKDGEIVNAAMQPGFSGKAVVCSEAIVPTASNNVIPKKQEHFKPTLIVTPSGDKVLDFGQNLAGLIAFTVSGSKGQRLKLLFGELLDEKGEFTQKNIHKHHKPVKEFGKMTELLLVLGMENKIRGELQPTPRQELQFFCSGQKDSYEMRFSVFGFRYVKVETEIEFKPENFEAIAVYSDLEQTGEFRCSHSLVNQLVSNTRWSMKGNFLDIPTDCPTRERLGWLGEGQTFFQTANYFMGAAPFYRKWLCDLMDGQRKDGKNSSVVPFVGFDMLYGNNGSSVGWADAMVLIPYRYWKQYGDREILVQCYDMMRRYGEFMIANTGQKDKKAAKVNPYNQYTYEKGVQLGEWLEPKEFLDMDNASGAKLTLQTEVCTAYLHYTMACLAEIAGELGKKEDGKRFGEYAESAKKAYHWLYLASGIPETDRQAKLVRPIALGLVEGKIKTAMEQRLAQAVENRQYRIGTGFLSTPFVLGVLTEAGFPELAYKMLENEELPGWLYQVRQGATTVWEDWEGTEFASRNHYAMGAVCQWLFDTVAGIRVDGKNHFVIAPVPGGTLTEANASYRSLYGTVESGWERRREGYFYYISVPENTTAQICLPGGVVLEVDAGKYRLSDKGQIV